MRYVFKKYSQVFYIFVIFLLSCGGITDPGNKTFWAYDIVSEKYYQVEADLITENHRCEIWAEKGSGVSFSTAQAVANEVRDNIYNKMMENFGWIGNININGFTIYNIDTMEFANWLTTGIRGNHKLTILFLNIRDGYNLVTNPVYTGGYFWGGDLLNITNSNKRPIVYINVRPAVTVPGSVNSYITIAHEMQHLLNFVSSLIFREYESDKWINEGLSAAAEWIYQGSHSTNRIDWFNYGVGLINEGNNFFMWDNHSDNNYAILDDYATVYIFFQWLRLQSNIDIFIDISTSEEYNYIAVLEAFNKNTTSETYSNWGDMLRDWYAANYLGNFTGRYGYGNDVLLNDLTTHYFYADNVDTISLYPGEGVYSKVSSASYSIPSSNENIMYAGLDSNLKETGSITNGALLTYNTNTNLNGSTETGKVTGITASIIPTSGVSGSRNAFNIINGPYSISAGDMLRRNNRAERGGAGFDIHSENRRLNFIVEEGSLQRYSADE
jgi:hypothetical protein